MTISAATSRLEHAGNGVTLVFNTPKIYDEDHIAAYLVEDADITNVDSLALTTDYTISNIGSANGTLTALVAPPSGYTLVIVRVVPIEQQYDYVENDNFPAASHERALDLLTQQIQQIDDRLDRSVRLSDSDTSGLSLELSDPTALYSIRVNSGATSLEFYDQGSVPLAVPADDSVTLAKMAEIAQYQMYIRTTSGTGNPEIFQATAAGVALLDDANSAAQRATLGVDAALILSLLPAGSVIGSSYASTATYTTIATGIPFDDTIPQKTEGTEIITVSITPSSTSSKVRVRFSAPVLYANNGNTTCAMFKDSVQNAIAVASVQSSHGEMHVAFLEFQHSPATTSAITYSVRIAASSGTIYVNGDATGRKYGGAAVATLVAEEIKV